MNADILTGVNHRITRHEPSGAKSLTDARDNQIMVTWTRELNASLTPLGIIMDGVDAASVLPRAVVESPYQEFRALGESDFTAIANAANEYCETDRITYEQIRDAVARTRWHWSDLKS